MAESVEPAAASDDDRGARLLPWIAAERGLRGLILIAIGVVLMTHAHTDWGRVIRSTARELGLDPSKNGIDRLSMKASALGPHKLVILGAVAVAYGVLEGVEGYGLFRRRRWAEYLTVFATSLLFIPEVWELMRKPTPLKVGGLLVNAAIVVYLVRRLRRQ